MVKIETPLARYHFQEGDQHPFDYDKSFLREDLIVHVSESHLLQVKTLFNCNIDHTFSCYGDVAKTVLLNLKI
jgi:hypothetical protein